MSKGGEIAKREPAGGVSRLRREMDRVFEDFFGPRGWGLQPCTEEWAPPLDVAETADKVVVKSEIPGMDPKEIDLSLTGDQLTIKGEKKSEREETKENYHVTERSYGSFARSVTLPAAVEADKIEARYEKGVLTITCPKKEVVKPKAIEIKSA
jgi:HSP20 family protein